MNHRLLIACLAAACALPLQAQTTATATPPSIGITAEAAYQLEKTTGEQVLFIDVRDPVEIMFVGNTDMVDANIPFMLANRQHWDSKNQRFEMQRNPQFIQQVEAALKARGLDKNATIITMCRSGSERGEPSAQYLREHGFPNALYVIHGFQGSPAKEGPQAGMRVVNGWQNSGLPWSSKLNPEKIYREQAPATKP